MTSKNTAKNEKYLNVALDLFQRLEKIAVTRKSNRFNDTEMRLLREILEAKRRGTRLISTKLADKLNITRSAVSQIVNRLEAQGVVIRVADAVDKKIAYIEVTQETQIAYAKILKECRLLIGDVVEEYGEERFEKLCDELDVFFDVFVKHKNETKEKK